MPALGRRQVSASYDGGPWQFGVQILDFTDGKVSRERIYVMAGWDAPEWRAPWRSAFPADPDGTRRILTELVGS